MANSLKVVFFDLGDTLVSSSSGWIAGAQDILSTLGAKGVRLGIISNTANLSRAELSQLLPADFDFDVFQAELVLLSSEVGVEKPSLEIFRQAVQRAGIDAQGCLFCTESRLDTLAAQQVGMRAVRVLAPPGSDLASLVNDVIRAGLLKT